MRHDRPLGRRIRHRAGLDQPSGAGVRSALEGARPSSFAPPSVLPDISPTRGEIGGFRAPHFPATSEIGESHGDG
ncbi:MAG: hypothetical protein E5W03_10335 [Mesorhizobium sp.]|nr:MAG: hypothetical protein E5W03_10335 [Mesorhizobium sp.]